MNRLFTWLWLGSLLISIVACTQQETFPEPPAQRRTNIRVFNGYASTPVDFRLNTFGGEVRFLVDRLTFGNSWPEGGYASLLTRRSDSAASLGVDSIAMDVAAYDLDTLLIEQYPENLPPETFASFYVVDSLGKAVMVKSSDDFIQPAGGQAAYRFINLYPQLNQVSFESDVDELGFLPQTFLNYTPFASVSSGTRNVSVINNLTGNTIQSMTVDLKSQGVYVFYLLNQNGIPVFSYERIY